MIPWDILAISWATSIVLGDFYTILKLRDRSTFGMRTSKSGSVVFLIKKSKYRNACAWSKSEIKLWLDEGLLIISRSTELEMRWFLRHWKATQRATIFVFCTRVSLTSIIEKIAVEVMSNSQQWIHDSTRVEVAYCSLISAICSATCSAFTLLSSSTPDKNFGYTCSRNLLKEERSFMSCPKITFWLS